MASGKKAPLREIWVVCLLLGLAVFNYPFVEIFNKDRALFGWPSLYLYFFICWPLIILVIYLFAVRFHRNEKTGEEPDETDTGPE